MQAGVDGLLRDKTRPSRIAALAQAVIERTRADPPGETTHWTAAAMAKEIGISISSVQRIWRAHKLQPHRVRSFKLSRDPLKAKLPQPSVVAKLQDIVGLYVDPPAYAIVLSVDERNARSV